MDDDSWREESQACRTEAEYAYTRKKPLIPVMFERGYKPDGWLGIIMGSKLYYNMHNTDEMAESIPGLVGEVTAVQNESAKPAFLEGGGGEGGKNSAAPPSSHGSPSNGTMMPAESSAPAGARKEKITVPQDADTMSLWLEGRGLKRYAEAFAAQHLYGKALIKMHEEIGYGDPAQAGYHELFTSVLGITSYGHRLLLVAELEELIGPIKWRRR